MRMGSYKLKKTIKILSITACLATLGFGVYGQLSGLYPAAIRNPRLIKAPFHHSIEGFRYSASHEGRPVLQFSSDLFEIHKKKIGILRFGLLNEAVFSNARIKLFDLEKIEATIARDADHPLSHEVERRADAAPAPAPNSFDHAFRPDLIAFIKNKRIVTAIFEPVQLELFAKGRKQIAIRAEKAVLNLKTREMEFTGNVQWGALSNKILTDRLIARLSQGKLHCPGAFSFNARNKTEHGRGFHADFFLRHLAVANRYRQQDLAKIDGDRR